MRLKNRALLKRKKRVVCMLRRKKTKQGFTMIELLMVIMLVAILGAVALPQFLDFRQEGRVAAAQQLQASINTGLKLQLQQARLRCGLMDESYTPIDALRLNDVTAGAAPLCNTSQLPAAIDRRVVDSPTMPVNPFNSLTTVGDCTSDTYVGWCYSVGFGSVVASTSTSPTVVASITTSCTYDSGNDAITISGSCVSDDGDVSINGGAVVNCTGGAYTYTQGGNYPGQSFVVSQPSGAGAPETGTCP